MGGLNFIALCPYYVLNFRMPEGLRSYKLCSYKKKTCISMVVPLCLPDYSSSLLEVLCLTTVALNDWE